MVTYSSDEYIAQPPEHVFRYLADLGLHPAWMDVSEAHAMDGQPTHQGSRVSTTLAKGPMKMRMEYEVTEFVPNQVFGYRSSGGRIAWDGRITVDPEGAGSRVRSSGSFGLRGVARLLQPLVGAEVRGGEANELKRLKQLLEAEA